jgi:hypothetical protein
MKAFPQERHKTYKNKVRKVAKQDMGKQNNA